MPLVTFFPTGKVLKVIEKTSLFDAALSAGLPLASSCSGDAVCGKCKMQILEGEINLSPHHPEEKKLLEKEDGDFHRERISCLTLVLGDCTVSTTYW